MHVKKDFWTEIDLLSLPSGENDLFDRKSGRMMSDSDFDDKLAKALSAFSNSGGGFLIIGIEDNGELTGVKEIYKGRVKTREWLEQKIPYLLSPVLQDFRVHNVTPSACSQIPDDKVIITIDIGDSDLAPHQSNKDQHYYYRTGGHSKAAPHQFLELLWKRTVFPGPKIAAAWVYKVINNLLYIPQREKNYLNGRNWELDFSHLDSLNGLEIILDKQNSGNFEQFYEYYPEIHQIIETHDNNVEVFLEALKNYFYAIRDSEATQMMFQETTKLEALRQLKDEKFNPWNHRLGECETVEDFYREIFPRLEKIDILNRLSEFIINGYKRVNDNNLTPFWNVNSESFLTIYNARCPEKSDFEKSRKQLLENVEGFHLALKRERTSLCTKYQLPFEESPQVIIQNQNYGYYT